MSILRSCPNLTTIRIQHVDVGAEASQEIDPIELGSLKSCMIVGVNNLTTRSLLACIRAPACTSLLVDYQAHGSEFLVALTGWFPAIRSMLKLSTQVYVEITGQSVYKSFTLSLRASTGSDTILDISFKKQPSSEPLEALLAHVAEAAAHVPTTINIHIKYPAAFPLPEIIAICTHFPALSQVQIWCRAMAESFVEHISHPLDIGGTPSWPFPQIKIMELRDPSLSVNSLLRMLKARYGPSRGLLDGHDNIPCLPGSQMVRLVFNNSGVGLGNTEMEEIRRLLPSCTLSCR
ncbi:hypothetical protein FRB94_008093 [Tulasnella sp. JGI-2019a]|nr:hypothetical protein FRB94_008093 [Tulasnella sp. JGI-2019a]